MGADTHRGRSAISRDLEYQLERFPAVQNSTREANCPDPQMSSNVLDRASNAGLLSHRDGPMEHRVGERAVLKQRRPTAFHA